MIAYPSISHFIFSMATNSKIKDSSNNVYRAVYIYIQKFFKNSEQRQTTHMIHKYLEVWITKEKNGLTTLHRQRKEGGSHTCSKQLGDRSQRRRQQPTPEIVDNSETADNAGDNRECRRKQRTPETASSEIQSNEWRRTFSEIQITLKIRRRYGEHDGQT